MKKRKDEYTENQDFDFTELTALCEHLESKEKEGYRLKKIDKYNLTYDISEEREMHYSAVIFNRALMHDEFIDACKQEGWEYVSSFGGLYIFRTQNPDATKIMTDEKENFRTVTKTFLLNPRFLGFSYVTFNTVFRLITHCITRWDLQWDPPLSADSFFILHLFLTSISLACVFIQTEDFLKWYTKAKKAVRNGEEIPYMNLKERKLKLIGRQISYSTWIITVSILFTMIFYGYYFEKTLFTVYAIIISLAGGIIIFKISTKGKLMTKILSILGLAVILAASYGFYASFDTAFNENPHIIKEDNIPVSVADFNYGECQFTNEISKYSGTRLGQYYRIDSECSCHDKRICYTVFISNYPEIRDSYIEEFKQQLDEYNTLISCDSESSDWDEYYRIVYNNGEFSNEGIAVKGNTVIYNNYLSDFDSDFFDVAYSKMFG